MVFENKSQEEILEDLLSFVPANTNKEEGTLIYCTLAAVAEKMAAIYIDLEEATENTYADTADREHLIRIAAERGLVPTEATSAIYKAYFNCEIAIGDRFSPEDTEYILTVIEKKEIVEDKYYYLLETEDTGVVVNNLENYYLDYIEGDSEEFETGYLESLEVAAVNEQDTEEFRQEYFDNAKAIPFSGNVQAYIQAVKGIKGVGACKVVNDNNKILITIVDVNHETPSEELVKTVQDIIDPDTDINHWGEEYGLPQLENYKGKGYGLAPIDHDVLIQAATDNPLNIVVYPFLLHGYTIEDVEEKIKENIKTYVKAKKEAWQQKRNIKISKNEIIALLLNIEGIDDISNVTINGSSKVTMEYNETPVVQNIEVREA